ncbi:MAG: L,D-transpeptidase [Eubacteriales bacterium]|nr:L,D-transpeptidase [Eubacteriales bacterium]
MSNEVMIMPLGRHLIKTLLLACLVIAALFAFGCAEAAQPAEATPTPEPVIVSMEVVDFNVTDFGDMPAPTATPEPTPPPLPFSHYAPSVKMTYEELVGSTDDMSKSASELLKEGYPDPKTYYVLVDLHWQVVMVYMRIDDGTTFGKPDLTQPVRYMICSSGNPNSEHGHETTMGIFQIQIPKGRFYQFVNLEAAQYLTLIRSRTYFHSILYDKAKNLGSLIQESYDDLGTKASHACIRLTVPDARWIWYNIGYGTTCEIRKGDPLDADTGSIRAQLILPPSIPNVRLKAGEAPWTDNWRIEDLIRVLDYKYAPLPLPDLGDGDDDLTPTPSGAGGEITPPPAETPTPYVEPTLDPNPW